MAAIFTNFPNLEHLNTLKNPINPMLSGAKANYTTFRAKVKNWLPKLQTLDGTEFDSEKQEIEKLRTQVEQAKPAILQRFSATAQNKALSSIPEETPAAGAGKTDGDVFDQLKQKNAAAKATTAAAGAGGKSTY